MTKEWRDGYMRGVLDFSAWLTAAIESKWPQERLCMELEKLIRQKERDIGENVSVPKLDGPPEFTAHVIEPL